MTDSRQFDDNQFVISIELLKILAWLLENKQETMKSLIAECLSETAHEHFSEKDAEYLQETIIDFFSVLETLIVEVGQEEESKKILQRNLIPAIDHIDSSACDKTTVELSVAKATSVCSKGARKSAQDVMFKELLKRWKPHKKHFN
ncbi:hypothetical protein M1446_01370 [Candidatus Dependentiae bacterium]|nr:hypothetical protein [Candidatus Dependentiae bacterium]